MSFFSRKSDSPVLYQKLPSHTSADFSDDESGTKVELIEDVSTSSPPIPNQPDAKLEKVILTRENIILCVGVFLFLAAIALFVVVSMKDKNQVNEPKFEEKQQHPNSSYFHTASHILEAMDLNVDPCADFYTYSCGNWIDANPVPGYQSVWNNFRKLEQQNYLVIKNILEQPIDTFKSKAEKKAKMYYDSCLDANDTMETLGAKPMLELIEKLGGWNISDSGFNVNDWTLQSTLQIIQNKYSVEALFSYIIDMDEKNSNRYVLKIGRGLLKNPSGLVLPNRDEFLSYSDDITLTDYDLESKTKIGVLLGGEENSTQEQMQAVRHFEDRLDTISFLSNFGGVGEYQLMTLADLQNKANFINWQQFFGNAMEIVQKSISSKQQILVYVPEYLENLVALIEEYEQTTEGKIILNNYLVWKVVEEFTPYLSRSFRGYFGNERHKQCIQETIKVLGFAVGATFVGEVFYPDAKEQAAIMVNNIKKAFKKNFNNLMWMDDQTREVAIDKVDAILDMIGYPEFIKDDNLLDELYENLIIRPDTYFENRININSYTVRKNLENFNEPVDKTAWITVPSAVNAFYYLYRNQMVIPAGILQTPFYDPLFPPSLNYGAMGVFMGHELTHGFDNEGRKYDKNGNLDHWWNNKTIEKFNQRTQCLVDQYDDYTIDDFVMSGTGTLDENIADNGGLKAAYQAYLNLMKDQPEPRKLPGLPLNHKQLFFVAFAQVWCSTDDSYLDLGGHSRAKYRVSGSVSNLKEFSEEFQCMPGSKMNPINKCEVW